MTCQACGAVRRHFPGCPEQRFMWNRPDLAAVNAQIMAERADRERAIGANLEVFSWGRHARSVDLSGHASHGHKNRDKEPDDDGG